MSERTHTRNADAVGPLVDILERVSDAFVALDKDWRYTYVNEQAARLFGRRPEDLIGRHIWTEFPEGVGQPFHRAYEKAMSEQTVIQLESYYEPWDRWFENRIFPSPDGLSIFFHEITERKRAEDEACRSAALLKGQNQVLELIARGTGLELTLATLAQVIEASCPEMLCSVLLLDPDGEHVRHVAAPSLPAAFSRAVDGQPIGPRAGSCGTAAFRRTPVVVEDIGVDPLWADYRDLALEHNLRACWSTPIFDSQQRVLGTFAVYFRRPRRPETRHLQLIDISTHIAAIAICRHRETEALRASEERLRVAVTGGNVGTWEWEVESNRLLWSDELKAIFGWPPETADLTLEIFLDAVHPDDLARIRAAIHRALAERADYDVEYRILRTDGSVRWLAAKGCVEHDVVGRPVRMRGVGLDITDRKQAEQEIRRREAQLAEAQRIAQLGSYEWDVRRNTVYRSDELCRIFGVAADQFPPTFEGYLERVHPDDRRTTQATIEQALAERRPFEFEERIVRPDGAVRLLHSRGQWIFDDAGAPVKLVGICHDVTSRWQAEDELRRSERRFQVVARATNNAIWDWDLSNNAVWWNESLSSAFGYAVEDAAAGIQWKYGRIHPDDLVRVVAGIADVMERREQLWSGEYRFRRADDSYADIFDRAFVIYEGSTNATRMIGAMADITDRKRALETLESRVASRTAELRLKNDELEREVDQRRAVEAQLRARNEELKAFAYTVSHDLKAPLRGIAGYAQELNRQHYGGLDERATWCLRQILTGTSNLDRLIEDLLQYCRLGAETATSSTVDLHHLVTAILSDRKSFILEHHVEVTTTLSSSSVRTWQRGLLQILTNLIDNALKYSRDAHPPRLHVASEDVDDRVRIVIADNGIGFDMRYHDRIFGLFNRLVRQEEFEGTGAGLAIVKKLTDKLAGRIWAESQPGRGASFYLELPNGRRTGATV
jgi:PAS domain S-box-containing protein